jgi:hypothetical protein
MSSGATEDLDIDVSEDVNSGRRRYDADVSDIVNGDTGGRLHRI